MAAKEWAHARYALSKPFCPDSILEILFCDLSRHASSKPNASPAVFPSPKLPRSCMRVDPAQVGRFPARRAERRASRPRGHRVGGTSPMGAFIAPIPEILFESCEVLLRLPCDRGHATICIWLAEICLWLITELCSQGLSDQDALRGVL